MTCHLIKRVIAAISMIIPASLRLPSNLNQWAT